MMKVVLRTYVLLEYYDHCFVVIVRQNQLIYCIDYNTFCVSICNTDLTLRTFSLSGIHNNKISNVQCIVNSVGKLNVVSDIDNYQFSTVSSAIMPVVEISSLTIMPSLFSSYREIYRCDGIKIDPIIHNLL